MEHPKTLDGPWRVARLNPEALPQGVDPASVTDLHWIDAKVPGAVQYDLVRSGDLENPFSGTAAAFAAKWVAESNWVYEIAFDVDPGASERWALEFEGIDTFAEIWLNGFCIGTTANANRQYRFDFASSLLRPTGNRLVIVVRHHEAGIVDKIPEARRILGHKDGVEGRLGKSLIRRYQRSFFSGNSTLLNVGTGVLGIGINGPVRLIPVREVEVIDLFVRTESLTADRADLVCFLELVHHDNSGQVEVTLELADPDKPEHVVATETVSSTASGKLRIDLVVDNPKPWWPRGYGAPALYTMTVRISRASRTLDTLRREIGIRTVKLLQKLPSGRPTFQLVVNGQPVWVRGTNLIPFDYLKVHGDPEDYVRIFALLDNGNINFIRMWGGGAVESDEFYDRCDRSGIMIWQDAYLHSMYYPEYDPEFVENFREESRQMITKLRRHACLTVLCGGNEQREGWDEWGWPDELDRFWGEGMITELIPSLVEELAPGVPYVDNSPHGDGRSGSPISGDGHIWGNHFNSLKDPLFVSETCWSIESYSRAETLKEVMDLDVRDFSGKGWVQKWTDRTGRPLINKFPYSSYHPSGGLGPYIRALELEQGLADHHSLSNFRLRSPSCSGIVYWSFNKGGPLFQFGAVDYALRPMMSYYIVTRLYRDVVVGLYRDLQDIRVVASNVSATDVEAEIELVHLRTDGTIMKLWTEQITLPPGRSIRVMDLDDYYSSIVQRDREVMYAQVKVGGSPVADDLLLFAPLVDVCTPESGLSIAQRQIGADEWELEFTTKGLSKLVQIENSDGLILSDNYFPLAAGYNRTIRVTALEKSGAEVHLDISSLDAESHARIQLERGAY